MLGCGHIVGRWKSASCVMRWKRRLGHHVDHAHSHHRDPLSVFIYGDSNTWGYDPDSALKSSNQRFPYHVRWTSQCQELLGSGFHIIPNGLNGRTTVFSDLAPPPVDGEYDCNGRLGLSVALHSNKPLDIVVIALGANDLKDKFNASPHDIISGVRVLIKDVQRQTNIGTLPKLAPSQSSATHMQAPHILVIGPPILKCTPLNRLWGIGEDSELRSRKVNSLLSVVCRDMKVSFLSIASIAEVSAIDGVHFPSSEQGKIAKAVASQLQTMATLRH